MKNLPDARVAAMNAQERSAYDWWIENQSRDINTMTSVELRDAAKHQDVLYLMALGSQ